MTEPNDTTNTTHEEESNGLANDMFEFLLGISRDEDIPIKNYIEYVANNGLLPYRATIHYGEKAGKSLYTHILNGIFVLDRVRRLLRLSDIETQVLFTAYTLHDINKMVPDGDKVKYEDLMVRERVEPKLREVGLHRFFPEYADYLIDCMHLMRQTSGRLFGGLHETLDLRKAPRYGLEHERVQELVHLMRAADKVDLSHTLAEQRHKNDFLDELNAISATQYTFVTHRVAEQRGSFTNILHNAAMEELHVRYGLEPLLIYPDGAAYLCPRNSIPTVDDALLDAIATRAAGFINEMNSKGFEQFIKPANMGITIDHKCLDLGIPFEKLFGVVETTIEKRPYKADKREQLTTDATRRMRETIEKQANPVPDEVRTALETLLETTGPVPQTTERLRIGELVRSYYIFVKEHFGDVVPDPWGHVYDLLDIAAERRAMYDMFHARLDRAYALVANEDMPDDTIRTRIYEDGTRLMQQLTHENPRAEVLKQYVRLVFVLSGQTAKPDDFAHALPNYVKQKHKQCVQCSLPLPTTPWISGDVRDDIKVNVFSNRLRGGPGEPKRNVCSICQMQFLVEKLNYRAVRGEKTVYLHLFPYSFQTEPFVRGIRQSVQNIVDKDWLTDGQEMQALRLSDVDAAIRMAATDKERMTLRFTRHTKEKKPQPYGLYMPRYSETLGGIMTFPINAVGENDTERFLFAVHYAVLLQRHFGCKVLVSTAVTPPLERDDFGDVYFDLTPLSSRGLIRQNDYSYYQDKQTQQEGTLPTLWRQLGLLAELQRQLVTMNEKPTIKLVQAMGVHPLQVFYVAEKLAEKRAGSSGSEGWIMQAIVETVRELAMSTGEREMQELDVHLQRLAEIAWKGGIRGKSLERHSLMSGMDEVLRKMNLLGTELNQPVLRAAAAQELFDHIKRVYQHEERTVGRTLSDACEEFVQVFFDDVFEGVYNGKQARLLNHEKTLRSAFHFYMRKQIHKRKAKTTDNDAGDDVEATNDAETADKTDVQEDMQDTLFPE